MNQFHVNPETGQVNKCKALLSCPFGSGQEHFETADNARKFFENKMVNNDFTSHRKNIAQDPETLWSNVNRPLYEKMKKSFISERKALLDKFKDSDPEDNLSIVASAEYQRYKEYLSITGYTHGNTAALNGSFSSSNKDYALEDLQIYRPSGSDPAHHIEKYHLSDNFANLKELSESLDDFLANNSINTGEKIVYRGMNTIPSHWKLEENEEVFIDSYLSSSLDPKVAIDYAGALYGQDNMHENVVFEMKTNNGAYVNGMQAADRDDEREILFARNTTWKILAAKTIMFANKEIRIFTLEEQ